MGRNRKKSQNANTGGAATQKRNKPNEKASNKPAAAATTQSNGSQSATAAAMKQRNGTAAHAPATNTDQQRALKNAPSAATLSRLERDELVLHKRPFKTIYYAFLEAIHLVADFLLFLTKHKFFVLLAGIAGALIYYAYVTPGPHQARIGSIEKTVLWSAYWLWLGVLSSIGLGSGLHTFLLYLGPHIARVTLAAFDCKSLDFPEPPYPTDIVCPENSPTSLAGISLWNIINKVRLEALMWGAGTALGELPPYFMARTARLSGQEPDDDEYAEYLEYVQGKADKKEMSTWEQWKFKIEKLVVSAGFIGILLFASIPNPLFDLAGIICGHSLISFWTFFGATLIGKALIKAHVQMLFVILTFSEHHVETFLNLLKTIPTVGPYVEPILKEFFIEQKRRLHRSPTDKIPDQKTPILQQIITVVVALLILNFVYEIVNSFAKAYHKRATRKTTVPTKTTKVQ